MNTDNSNLIGFSTGFKTFTDEKPKERRDFNKNKRKDREEKPEEKEENAEENVDVEKKEEEV